MIELTVLDENGDKAPNFLGKLAIPLLTVSLYMISNYITTVTGFSVSYILISDIQNMYLLILKGSEWAGDMFVLEERRLGRYIKRNHHTRAGGYL